MKIITFLFTIMITSGEFVQAFQSGDFCNCENSQKNQYNQMKELAQSLNNNNNTKNSNVKPTFDYNGSVLNKCC